ncbi:MAG: arginine--tRNA ligase [Proteobacteria bacterium]|nr:arginine--tRNA ligase [Pseudomonadota bacterium]
MNIFNYYRDKNVQLLEEMVANGELPAGLDYSRVKVEPPREAAHGDMATNAAMVLAKPAGKNPRQLGDLLVAKMKKLPEIREASVAGPGFVNFRLVNTEWSSVLIDILSAGVHYGDSKMGKGEKVNVEYVSVNPTGPMHAGHVRGAVIGDTLANLLEKSGFDVTREYYFNDAGTQVDVLARTAYLRYREALSENIGEVPEGLYPGDYMKDVGQALAKRDGKKWLGKDEKEWLVPIRDFSVRTMMDMIKQDLALIGITHEVFSNEREVVEGGTLDKVFKILQDMDLIYTGTLPPPKGKEMEDWEPAELTLFRSSKFGDSSDRPLKKRDGTWAYIMPDIAYHFDKIQRGYKWMINVLGKDHGNYLDKMRPAVAALSGGKARIDVMFCGMVKILKDGVPVKFSKRSGNIITLREMIEEVGADATRFFMLSRTPDSELEFDFAKVVEQTKDNPVFYVQYAHARCCSVLRNAKELWPDTDVSAAALAKTDVKRLNSEEELKLVRMMAGWPRYVESAAEAHEPHRVTIYLHDLASEFHAFWNKGSDDTTLRFLIEQDKELSPALVVFAGILWYAYPRGAEKYSDMDVPVVKADTSPVKTVPADPGGMEVPHQDSTVFDPLQKNPAAEIEKLLPAQEEPINKDVDIKPAKPGLKSPTKDVKSSPDKVEVPKVVVAKPAIAASGDVYVQLGSYHDMSAVKRDWEKLKKKFPDLFGTLDMKIEKVDLAGKGTYYRLQAGTTTADHAKEICAALKAAHSVGCIVVRK